MMAIEELKNEWKKDSQIDSSKIREEILKSAQLHSKYLTLLMDYKREYRKKESNILTVTKVKMRYYRGELTKTQLDSMGWEQYQGTRPIKSEMDSLLNTDADLIELHTELEDIKIILDSLESIMKAITSRSYDLKTFIEAEKFYAGGY